MAISTTELGTIWEPATSLWDRAIALNSASFPFPNIASAQGKKIDEYAPKQKQNMQIHTYKTNKNAKDRMVGMLSQFQHKMRDLVLG